MNKADTIKYLDKTMEWALYMLIFWLPFSKSIIEISLGVAAASLAAKKILLKDFKIKKTPLDIALLAFFLFCAISVVNSDFKLLVIKALFTKCAKFILLYFVIVETIDSQIKFKNFIKMSLISAVIVMIDSYIQLYLTNVDLIRLYPSFKFTRIDPKYVGFPTGPFPFQNDLSAWMLVILMPALCLFMRGIKNRLRFALGIFLIPFLFLFYLANTRSAWLAFLVSTFITFILENKKALIAVALVLIIIFVPFLPKERVKDIVGLRSMEDRFYMWRVGWRIFLEHPVIGNGLNTFFQKFKEYREDEYRNQRGSYAHNGYLQIASDVGVLGLGSFLLLIGLAFVSAYQYIRNSRNVFYKGFSVGLVAGMLAFLIHAFFDTNLQSLPLVTLFWVSLAILMSIKDIEAKDF